MLSDEWCVFIFVNINIWPIDCKHRIDYYIPILLEIWVICECVHSWFKQGYSKKNRGLPFLPASQCSLPCSCRVYCLRVLVSCKYSTCICCKNFPRYSMYIIKSPGSHVRQSSHWCFERTTASNDLYNCTKLVELISSLCDWISLVQPGNCSYHLQIIVQDIIHWHVLFSLRHFLPRGYHSRPFELLESIKIIKNICAVKVYIITKKKTAV